jgi:hypothetical protein
MDSSQLMTDQKKDGALTAQTNAKKIRNPTTSPTTSDLDRIME